MNYADPHDLRREKNPVAKSLPRGYRIFWTNIDYLVDDNEEDPDQIGRWIDQAYDLAQESGINILHNTEGYILLLHKKGRKEEVTGAVFYGVNGYYHFDTIVAGGHRGKGFGSLLLDLGLANYDDYAEAEIPLELDVVNLSMRDALLKRGYVILHRTGFSNWIIGKAEIDEESEMEVET